MDDGLEPDGLKAVSAVSDDLVGEDLRVAADLAAEHLRSRDGKPVWRPTPPQMYAALQNAPLPREGRSTADLLAQAGRDVLAFPMGNGSAAFFGWVNAAPHPAALAAGLLAGAMNPSSAGGDHADVPLERAV